jgi:hypothetical protein
MTRKVQWGVLGAANIAIKKMIPAMVSRRLFMDQRSNYRQDSDERLFLT